MTKDGFITWDSESGREKAIAAYSDTTDSYAGVSKGYHTQTFIGIESNRSVRPQYGRDDYYAFRPGEKPPQKHKHIIKMCMDAYEKVGIVRNIIDLMGDFGCQGVNIVHENKSVEKFYQQWFNRIGGKERSERFLNLLYRSGNVFAYRSNAKITPQISKYIKSIGSDVKVELPQFEKNSIPWRYNFFNPLSINLKDGVTSLFVGSKHFNLNVGPFVDNFKDGSVPSKILETLPPEVKERIRRGDKTVPLDPERLIVHYYKKDDWSQWANPLIYAILDDIIMLEKMRLADMSALDGAISNIRLWTLGNLDHKILPNKTAINKLRDILASNVGGGTMELVWGPELTYEESNSQVYKFLGSEKYTSVLNSIYAGLGVPPTLTGMAGNGGGFTNNFISLKTLVERLQYGRDQLTNFWANECEIIRKAMGFRKSPHIVYDQMSLSDEAAEKNLLIQLADRDIISNETVLERFKEIPQVEKVRLKREDKERGAGFPKKASPFHNANHDQDMEKIEKQGELNRKNLEVRNRQTNQNGRPPQKKDDGPRKKRVDTPKSKPGTAEFILWSNEAFEKISEITNKAFLINKNKTNLRNLTKAEAFDLENLKIDILCSLPIMSKVTPKAVIDILKAGKRASKAFSKMLHDNNISRETMNIETYRKHAISMYIAYSLEG